MSAEEMMPAFYDNFPGKVYVAWIRPSGSDYTNPVSCTASESSYWAETEKSLWERASWWTSNGNQTARKLGWDHGVTYATFASTDRTEVQNVIDTANHVAAVVADSLGLTPMQSVKYRKN